MIIGIGCDVVEISRIEKLIHKETAVKKLFTDKERKLLEKQPNKAQWAAGRFAAKEAASKALKAGIAKCPPDCVEILYDDNGAPTVAFLGKARSLIGDINYRAHVSITHDAGIAEAFVIIEKLSERVKIKDEKAAKKVADLLPERKKTDHKGDMGKVAVLAGSGRYSGAGYLSTLGAIKAGAGLVTWCRSYDPVVVPPEAMSLRLPDNQPMDGFVEFCKDMDSAVIGPGLGLDFANQAMPKVLNGIKCSKVLDADALNAISEMGALPEFGPHTVITPHVGEAARLLKCSAEHVSEYTEDCAKELANKTNAIVVIKCHESVVCSPKGRIFVNSTGNPGMATGGSGDVLSGIIGALLKRLDPYDAARYSVYLHGLAGDIACLKKGENSMTAIDVAESVADAFKILEEFRTV